MSVKLDALRTASSATVREVMHKINRAPHQGAPSGVALVVGEGGQLEGVITDGDIRRALIGGHTLDSAAADIMTREPVTIRPGLTGKQVLQHVIEKGRRNGHRGDLRIEFLVVADEAGRPVDVISTLDLMMRADIKNWSVGVIGLGFVGLTLAVSLAEVGFEVHGVDTNADVVARVTEGAPHFHEVGLEPLLKHHLAQERLHVHTELPDDIDIYIVSVGTPLDAEGKPGMGYVRQAAEAIGPKLKREDLVLLRSTVPVGTTQHEVKPILEETSGLQCGKDFYLAFAPERTVEGNALSELRTLPQIVGGYDDRSTDVAAQFFGKLASNIVRVGSLEAAEMVKLINNTFRDLSFAFANELAVLCDHWDLDAVNVIRAANTGYPRNPVPLPSPGVGGFCLTKDPLIYAYSGLQKGYEPKLPVYGRQINAAMTDRVADKVLRFLETQGKATGDAKLFLLGFAFKGQPETSDVRFSPTLDLLPLLNHSGIQLFGHDPVVSREVIAEQGVTPAELEEGFAGADAVILMNNHASYANLDLYDLLPRMRRPSLFLDGWHTFARHDVEQVEGVTYEGISGAR